MTTELEMETVFDFIEAKTLELDVLPIHTNPLRSMTNQQGLHYSCRITNKKAQSWIAVYFTKGEGLRIWKQPSEQWLSKVHVPLDKIGMPYDGPLPPWTDETEQSDRQSFELCSIPEPPLLSEILDVLAIDCFQAEQYPLYEVWAVSLKGNPDSIMLREAWNAVNRQQRELRALFGEADYFQLLYEIDRLPQPQNFP